MYLEGAFDLPSDNGLRFSETKCLFELELGRNLHELP